MRISAFMVTACAATAVNVEAANYYIRDGATGSTCSSWADACDALPTTLVRGSTYYIADGAYSGRVFGTAASGSTLIIIKKATLADHGSDTGWSDTYGDGQATFMGGLEFTSSYWLIDGQTGGGVENQWNKNFGFAITETSDETALLKLGWSGSADHIELRHLAMQGKGSASGQGGSYSNDGLAVYGATDVTLSHFWMRGIGRGPFFLSGRNLIIEHGWVESFFGSSAVHSEVASIWGFDGNVGDLTFRYNLFTDIQSTGGLMWDNSTNPNARLWVYGNVFYRPAGANWGQANGVIGGWTGGGSECRNIAVDNNTFINVDQQSLSTFPQVFSGNSAHNNLFYNCDSPDFGIFPTHDFNHFINSGGSHGEPNGTSATSGDPFVDFANLDFRLKAPTAASGPLVAPFDRDAWGNLRGADGTADRGAYEYVANSDGGTGGGSGTGGGIGTGGATGTGGGAGGGVGTGGGIGTGGGAGGGVGTGGGIGTGGGAAVGGGSAASGGGAGLGGALGTGGGTGAAAGGGSMATDGGSDNPMIAGNCGCHSSGVGFMMTLALLFNARRRRRPNVLQLN